MRIVFVRHGYPDYDNDCLTDLGYRQAEMAAERLREENFHSIYSSPCGRALQTAECIANVHKQRVEICDFMREMDWGSVDGEPIMQNGHPWNTAEEMILNGQDILSQNWENEEPYCRNRVVRSRYAVCQKFDSFLEDLGYMRAGDFYRVCRENDNTYAMISHAGSSSAVLAHMFNISFPYFCQIILPDFTSITIVSLCGKAGDLVAPRFEIVNDARHTKLFACENLFGN